MECFAHSCFSESWGSPILELFVRGIEDPCAHPASQRSGRLSRTGIQGHCGLRRLGRSACTVFTCFCLCVLSSSSQDADPSNLPTEPPHLGSVCRNDGQEAWSRPVLLGMVPGLRAKAQPCQPFTNVQCQQESWKFWRTEKRFQVHAQLMLHCRARVATADQPSFQKGLCHQAGTGSGG